jgi:hypothetical protein
MQLRSEVNKILENARTGKLIGSSLDAKVYLHTESSDTVLKLKELSSASNDADTLHRLFITSQVRHAFQNDHLPLSTHNMLNVSFIFCRWMFFQS